MGNFNRGGRSGREQNFNRGSFNNRDSDRQVVMHSAICGKCGKDCEVPFKPTNDRPVFCSSCFENNRNSDSRRFENINSERPTNFDDRQMFNAVCADCGNSCQVPFQPSNGKPVFCSNCFGDKKEGGSRNREQFNSQPQYKEQFEELNNKLNKILTILTPNSFAQAVADEITEVVKEKTKVAKKKPSKVSLLAK